MHTLEALREANKDFSCLLPEVIYKIRAMGTLLQCFDYEENEGLLLEADLRGIGAILWDTAQELQVVNNALYGEE